MRIDEFLLARISDRETAWRVDLRISPSEFTRWSVAQGLAECKAMRRIVHLAFDHMAVFDGEWGCAHPAEQIRAGECPYMKAGDDDLLRILAAIWSDHPDHDPAWVVAD